MTTFKTCHIKKRLLKWRNYHPSQNITTYVNDVGDKVESKYFSVNKMRN